MIFRPSYQTTPPTDAHFFTKKGVKMARFRLANGRQVEGRVMPNGKVSIQTDLYYARIRRNGKATRVPLGVTDKLAAEQIAAKLQLDAQHQRAGIIDPLAKHRGTPLPAFKPVYPPTIRLTVPFAILHALPIRTCDHRPVRQRRSSSRSKAAVSNWFGRRW